MAPLDLVATWEYAQDAERARSSSCLHGPDHWVRVEPRWDDRR